MTTDQRVDRIGEDVDPVARTVPSELRRISPAVRDLRGDVNTVATESLPAVETHTRELAGVVIPLADNIDNAHLPALTTTVDRLAQPLIELLADQPVGETVAETHALLVLIKRLDLIQIAARGLTVIPRIDQTLVYVNGTVHSLHDLLVDVHGQLNTSRQVQCITLTHIASIDRKTGGPLAPDAQTSDRPPAGRRDVTP